MRKAKMLVVFFAVMGVLAGCSKFSPEETTVSVGKDGKITAAVIDTLDQNYYQADELKTELDKAIAAYNSSAGEDTIQVDKFETEEGNVSLFMKYAAYKDYAAFNNVTFYAGDISDGYNNGGFRFETTFQQIENGEVVKDTVTREEIFAGTNHSMIVFQEPMAVEVPGKILYASSDLTITGKKSARPSELDKETETSGETEVLEIAPAQEVTESETSAKMTLYYIIYD